MYTYLLNTVCFLFFVLFWGGGGKSSLFDGFFGKEVVSGPLLFKTINTFKGFQLPLELVVNINSVVPD